MSNMWAYPGRKVVCIVDFPDEVNEPYRYWRMNMPNLPKKDGVYTIRTIETDSLDPTVAGIRLEECVNPEVPWRAAGDKTIMAEGQIHIIFFRPLDERKTDISVFTNMLGPQPVHA